MHIVDSGKWRYGDVVAFAWIVRQNWDFFHEEGFADEPPQLNEQGHAYYVLSGLSPDLEHHLSRSRTLLSEDEARREAERLLPGIEWTTG